MFCNGRHDHSSLYIIMQTMGGVFSGKDQDATRGIYALAGTYLILFLYIVKLGTFRYISIQ